jgi:hypothetical protein
MPIARHVGIPAPLAGFGGALFAPPITQEPWAVGAGGN